MRTSLCTADERRLGTDATGMTEGEAMTALTIERLGHTVGAVLDGVDCDRLVSDDGFPGWCLDRDEGRALLNDLLAQSTVPESVYRHQWGVGDMVIWDNRGVLHRALPYDPTSPRDMHRTTLAGDEVIR
jgi:hypothetical protein